MAQIPNKQNTQPQEADNYSVDEMMARLKRGERRKQQAESERPEDGEGTLVTREDGTQVIKVKRRKRRSQQPSKKSSRLSPRLKWAMLGVAGGLGVILIAGTVFIIAKYNGKKFKLKTESTITGLSGATETELTQLRVTPVSAKASRTELTWGPHAFIKEADFGNIRANIKATSFFSSDWIGEEVVASTGNLTLQQPIASVETNSQPPASPYQFGAYRCNQLSLFFGDDKNAPAIKDLEVSLRQMENERYQIVIRNGSMHVANWPELKLSSGIVTLNSDSADIEALLDASESHNGELTIKGNVSKNINHPISLNVEAKNYPVQEVLGKDMGRLLHGEVQSNQGVFTYDYGKPSDQALSFVLPFNAAELQLEGLPMLKALNKLIGDTAYVRPSFFRCRGTVIRTAEGLSLNDLELTNNNLLTLFGNIHVDASGTITGQLKVGVPQSAFDEKVPAPFEGPVNGFYHTTVTLSGTTRTPNDNLHDLLRAERNKRKQEPSPSLEDILKRSQSPRQTPGKPSQEDFDALTR